MLPYECLDIQVDDRDLCFGKLMSYAPGDVETPGEEVAALLFLWFACPLCHSYMCL